jgi:hypothetical protein
MPQFIYDKLNSFGKADLASAAAFPDVIDLAGSGVDRMTVDLKMAGAAAAGGTAVTLTVAGSDDPAFGTSQVLGSRAFTLKEINGGTGRVAINPNRYRYLKVTFAKTGTFTAGTVEALVNSYLGK